MQLTITTAAVYHRVGLGPNSCRIPMLVWCIAMVVMLSTSQLGAQPTQSGPASAKLNPTIYYLEDPDHSLSIEEVIRADNQGRLTAYQQTGALNFGLTTSQYWLKLVVDSSLEQPQTHFLEVGFYALTDIELFYPDNRQVATGQYQPAKQRPWPHRHLVFPIQTTGQGSQTFYLRAQSQGSLTLPLKLWEPRDFAYHSQVNLFWNAIYFGSAAALLIYNLFLSVSLRDRRYLFYCGFLFFTAFGMSVMTGLGAYYLTPIGWPPSIGTNTLFSLASVFAILFLRSFLNTAHELQRVDHCLQIFIGLFVVIALLPVTAVPVKIGVALLSLGAVVLGPALLAISLVSWRRKVPSAGIIVAAWTVLLIAVSAQAARNFGWLPTNFVTLNIMQIGSLLEMLLLAFALADSVRNERRQKEQAQDKAIESQKQLVNILRDSERALEDKVAARTRELDAALDNERTTLQRYVEFGALIAHEFRNPLAIIKNQTQVATIENANANQTLAPRLNAIVRAASRLEHLFDQYLRGDQLPNKLKTAKLYPLTLDQWLEQIIQPYVIASNHTIEVHDQAVWVIGDHELMEAAVNNLIDNALKHSPEHSTIVAATVVAEEWVGIAVTDQGAGVPESEHDAIFTKNYRSKGAEPSTGLGLGLYFVAEIMKLHQGHVDITNGPDHGCTFTLWLPRHNPRISN